MKERRDFPILAKVHEYVSSFGVFFGWVGWVNGTWNQDILWGRYFLLLTFAYGSKAILFTYL